MALARRIGVRILTARSSHFGACTLSSWHICVCMAAPLHSFWCSSSWASLWKHTTRSNSTSRHTVDRNPALPIYPNLAYWSPATRPTVGNYSCWDSWRSSGGDHWRYSGCGSMWGRGSKPLLLRSKCHLRVRSQVTALNQLMRIAILMDAEDVHAVAHINSMSLQHHEVVY